MQPIQLGRGNLNGSRLAYGCWRIAGNPDAKRVTQEGEAEGRAAVLAAYEAGYTLYDLADVYGDGACETILGSVLRRTPGMRNRIVLATKCGIRKKGVPAGTSHRYDFSREHIVQSCEDSLRRLGVETVDLLMLHRPDYLCDPAEVAEAFIRLNKEGKVREFGVSNFRPSLLASLQKACPFPLVVNQVEVSLSRLDAFTDGTLDQCLSGEVTPMAWSPLGGGRLVDDGPIDLQTPDHAHRIRLRDALGHLARERGVSRMVVALAWLLKHPARMVPIVGSTRPERIRDAVNAASLELSREEWYRLMESAQGHPLP